MDAKAYFQHVNSHRRNQQNIPPTTSGTVGEYYLGYSITNDPINDLPMLAIPQGSSYSSRQMLNALNAAQAQFFRHLPQNFVNEALQSNGTKTQGG